MSTLVFRALVSLKDATSIMKSLKLRRHCVNFRWRYVLDEVSQDEVAFYHRQIKNEIEGCVPLHNEYPLNETLFLLLVFREQVNK